MSKLNKEQRDNLPSMPPTMVRSYVNDMLLELSKISQNSGLNELGSLLRAAHAASTIDTKTED